MDERCAATSRVIYAGSHSDHPATRASRHGTRVFIRPLAAAVLIAGAAVYGEPDLPYTAPSKVMLRKVDTSQSAWSRELMLRQASGNLQALRMRADSERQRVWVLTSDQVHVYDMNTLELVRRVPLPDWPVAEFICPPDIVLDRTGAAFVSNNVQPRLFEIAPVTFRTKEHELRLVSTRKLDVGFGALAFADDGTLLALSAVGEALFRIDVSRLTATEIALPHRAPGGCAL
jgi:hypothetical protein